ncbi:MAG TPA: hypothetical protein VHM92_01775 [Allosphingosinicella sp.]|nr:hypothetical protein [Allosphingosinicella sp.]
MNDSRIAVERRGAPLGLFLDRLCGRRDVGQDPLEDEADELIEDFWRLARDLDAVLTPDVRHDLLEFLRAADANRETTARMLIAWVDLVEEVCLAVELDYGSGAGTVKLQRVRSVIFQLARGFLGDSPFPSLPAFVQPFATDLICHVTVEFIIQLVNTGDCDRSLWKVAAPPGQTPAKSPLVRARARVAAKRWNLYEKIAAWLLQPAPLPPGLQKNVDAILERWDAETALSGHPPVERVVRSAFLLLNWVGHHGSELRRAVDALSIATHWAYEFADLSEEERIELIKKALSRYLDELGLSGSLFQRIWELAIDCAVDAAVELLRKRLALP